MIRYPGNQHTFILVLSILIVHALLTGSTIVSNVGDSRTFNCDDSLQSLLSRGVTNITIAHDAGVPLTYYFIGYQQVTSNNQNPIMARFDGQSQVWCRRDYEVTGDDNKGYGMLYSGKKKYLYGIFSATGTQGSSSEDFRRFATNGWLRSYGQGGGPRVVVIARINPETGNPVEASFVTARLSNGNSNSCAVKDLCFIRANGSDHNHTDYHVLLKMDSFFSPRQTNPNSAMTCSGSSPFDWRLLLTSNLRSAVSSCVKASDSKSCVATQGCNNSLMECENITEDSDPNLEPVNPNVSSANYTSSWNINKGWLLFVSLLVIWCSLM